jgi:hypothetical protein
MARRRRALVIGGSLCGLLTAILLRNDEWEVEIFERVPDELSGRGAGIVTHPELLDTLSRCGVVIDDGIGVEVPTRVTLDASGRTIGEFPLRQILTSWGRLYALLKERFPAAAYHAGFALDRVEQREDSVVACFADAAGYDLTQFMRWYRQAGTPEITYCPFSFARAKQGFSKTKTMQLMRVWIEQNTSTRPGLSNSTSLTVGAL